MKCEDRLPPHIEIEVRKFGVMAQSQQPKVAARVQEYRRPTFDEHGEPDF